MLHRLRPIAGINITARTLGTAKSFMSFNSPLLENAVPKEPIALLRNWIADAEEAKIPLPMVASLASASLPSGRVSNRMVNVKELNSDGAFVLYSNFDKSRKGRDIATNSQVALTFYWQQLNRSIRVEGTLKLMSKDESEPFFNSRDKSFQASVLVGQQSTKVAGGREQLTSKASELQNSESDLKIPDFWTGAIITPDFVEFWQGSSDRISDRLAYTIENNGTWLLERLSP